MSGDRSPDGCVAKLEDLDTPFQEFVWHFRTFISRRLIELEFGLAAELAAKLAHLDEAQDPAGLCLLNKKRVHAGGAPPRP